MSDYADSGVPPTVVEPLIWMSWIEDHWDEAYILTAKQTVLNLVRVSTSVTMYTVH